MIEKNQSHDTVFLLISLGADRCLRFNYVISDRNVGSSAVTRLNVYVMGDSGTTAPPYVFDTNTGNSWIQAEIDLPSMENMKVILYPSTPPHPKNKKNQYLIFITKSFIRRLISVNDFFHTVLFLMQIIFEGVNGEQELAVDNIRISPQLCGELLNKHLFWMSALNSRY